MTAIEKIKEKLKKYPQVTYEETENYISVECRLKEFCRNNEPYKWTLEYKDGESWIEDSTTSLLNFSFWKEQTVNYLQNDLIK